MTSAQRTIDQEQRRTQYLAAQDQIQEDAPWLPIRHGVQSAAMGPQVKGFRLHPLGAQDFSTVTVK